MRKYKVVCSDGVVHHVDEMVIQRIDLLREMLCAEDGEDSIDCEEEHVNLPNVRGDVFKHILDLIDDPYVELPKPLPAHATIETTFTKRTGGILKSMTLLDVISVLRCADYIGAQPVVEICSAYIALLTRGDPLVLEKHLGARDPAKTREIIRIESDFIQKCIS